MPHTSPWQRHTPAFGTTYAMGCCHNSISAWPRLDGDSEEKPFIDLPSGLLCDPRPLGFALEWSR